MKKTKKGENMSYTVAINSSGQATIPKDIRDFLRVTPGENRLVFEVKDGGVTITKEKTPRQLLQESLKKIDRILGPKPVNKNKFAGMSFDEVREAWSETPEGKAEMEERYGVKL